MCIQVFRGAITFLESRSSGRSTRPFRSMLKITSRRFTSYTPVCRPGSSSPPLVVFYLTEGKKDTLSRHTRRTLHSPMLNCALECRGHGGFQLLEWTYIFRKRFKIRGVKTKRYHYLDYSENIYYYQLIKLV